MADLDFESKNYATLVDELTAEVKSQQEGLTKTGLTDFSAGSIIMTILRAIAAVLANNWKSLAELVQAFYISSAEGDALRRRFLDFGFTMKEGSPAKGVVQVVRPANDIFTGSVTTNSVLTFGGMNFIVTRASGSFGDSSATPSRLIVEVEAEENGVDGNLAIDTLLTPTDISYRTLTFRVGTQMDEALEHATQGGLTGGVDDETPEEARERFQEYIKSIGKGTTEAIKASVMSLPEVRMVTVYDACRLNGEGVRENGYPGHIVVNVQPTSLSDDVAALRPIIEPKIDEARAAGIAYDIQLISTRSINVEVAVYTDVGADDWAALKNKIEAQITMAFDALTLNSTLATGKLLGKMFAVAADYAVTNIKATYTYASGDELGQDATNAAGEIVPNLEGEGQALCLGSVSVVQV